MLSCGDDTRVDALENELRELKDAQSNIFCKVKEIISYASHSIIVGEVKELIHSGKIEPLIYQNGKYI